MSHFFTNDETDKIKRAAEGHVLEVIRDFQSLEEQKGYDYRGDCPICHKKTFNYNSKKGLFGCFNKCNVGGSDAISYLMKVQNMSYVEALQYLADRFYIELAPDQSKQPKKPMAKKGSKFLQGEDPSSFCARMLQASGLTFDDVTAHIFDSSENRTVTTAHTFTKGTVNSKGELDLSGDDAIIRYYDLAGLPVTYEQKDSKGKPTGKKKEYFRVRWQFPDAHLDKEGKPFKYRSPYGGGTPIYIPDTIRRHYAAGDSLPRLFIQEGEKKAEKACKHGMPSLAISGIQNIACGGRLPEDMVRIIEKCKVKEVIFIMDSDFNDLSANIKINDSVDKRPRAFFRLPEDMVRIIEKCKVKEVIFIMDSDFNDLSANIKINDSVDKRPRAFFYAAKNFKEYMGSLRNRDIFVEVYVGHTLKNSYDEKGVDDLLAGSLSGHEDELMKDLERLINEKSLTGKYLQLYRISSYTDYKLSAIWGLDSLSGHEDELMKDLERLINEKSLTGKYLQLYRISSYTDYKLSAIWGLDNVRHFAEMHKEVLSRLPEFRIGSNRWRINAQGVLESAQALESDETYWEAIQKSRRSGETYTEYEFRYVPCRRFLQNRGFGRFRRLDNTWQFIRLESPFVRVIEASEARDFLFEFTEANCPESVNEMISKGVTQYVGPDKLSLLKFIYPNFLQPNGNEQIFYFEKSCWRVTADAVKEFGYESIQHHVWAEQQRQFPAKYLGSPLITFSGEGDSLSYQLSEYGQNCHFLKFLINASNFTWRRQPGDIEQSEIAENNRHLLSKLCAIGFMCMEYKDVSVNRAVIGMDGKQSEVGASNGRSGKSLIGVLMKNIEPTAYLNGKRRDLLEDQFVWNDVDEKTKLVFIDDVLINFNFERLFPNLTGDWTVNYKGGRRITFVS